MLMPDLSHHSLATRLAVQFATVGGIGWLRPGPGTWASLLAGLFALVLIPVIPEHYVTISMAGAAAVTTLVALWWLPAAVPYFGCQDPGQIVIDEVVGVWVALAIVPAHVLCTDLVVSVVVVVLLFRVFDIAKPWPVNWFERLPGGLGIMADDLAAGVVAGCLATAMLH
jgi:phosphatidylglycerophosphatase A